MAETRLYCERHDDLAAPLGLCCHAAQEYNLARDDGDEFDHWSECRMVERVLSVPGEHVRGGGTTGISADDLLYEAWAVIANAGWDGAGKSEGWQEAAVRWRDKWHAYLDETTDAEEE